MTSDKKWRETYLALGCMCNEWNEELHVIEYAAYEQLKDKLAWLELPISESGLLENVHGALFDLQNKHEALQAQADALFEALYDIAYSEPKDNATTYPHAHKVLTAYPEKKKKLKSCPS